VVAIEPGQRLLHYRLIEKIGEGGMGVVWKATDTALDRQVAIKVLPETLAADAQRLARLEREAKLAASLNHPNIATVHGLHEEGDIRFVAMELVEGEDLAKRLSRGPFPQDEAFEVARQIADGLEAAHANGVIHRDLKPANVKVTADGRVKVLDFGLARAFETTSTSREVRPTLSPTLTSDKTAAGAILGTAAYMSPEQARGQVVDARADVWAFGVVLYEMLSGRSPFIGDTVSDTLASVLKVDPDNDALPPDVPNRIRRLVTRCLQKEPRKRLHHIADARIVLEETLAGVPDEEAPDVLETQKRRTTERLGWLAAVIVVAVAAAATAWSLRSVPADRPHRKLQIALDGVDPDDPSLSSARISPDGNRILYKSNDKIFIRDLDAWESREIPAAAEADQVFWSHDGESIGFIKDKTLSRAAADGSHVAVISELPGGTNGAAWGPDGKIILAGNYSDRVGIFELSERGGEPRELLVLEDDEDHFHNLDILPGGRGVLITIHRGTMKDVSLFADGKLTSLVEIESRYLPLPVYATSGHVLYTRGGDNEGIWALPFSAETFEIEGEPFLVAAGGGAQSVSGNGTLIYRQYEFDPERRVVWVDRQGEIQGSIGEPREGFDFPTISPDGKKIVVSAGYEADADLWILDVERGTQIRLSRGETQEYEPAWTPDGKRVVYRHRPLDGENTIRVANADGSGEPETLVEGADFSLSPDGRTLVFSKRNEQTSYDIWLLELGSEAEPVAFVNSASSERRGRVSPDGSALAYESEESGRSEIYLKRFPSGEGKWQVSLDGGSLPRWSPKGDELFWTSGGNLMVVEVRTGPEITLGTPRRLFSWEPSDYLKWAEYDVAADAERFVMVAQKDDDESSDSMKGILMLVENWSAE
jgi:serine/threonine-protein kinase